MNAKDDEDTAGSRRPYTPRTAAAKAGCNIKTIYEAVAKKQVPSFRLGRKLLIPRRPFDQLVDEGRVG
jgi:excisionase family DNA binding protein